MINKYRKKPVEIEAIQLNSAHDIVEAIAWIHSGGYFASESVLPEFVVKLATLEGDMHASKGDYIIKGVQGEFYPCKPDIFAKTYEEL